MNEEALEEMFSECDTGVYYGWAQVGEKDTTVYPMVMSLGWNPYYKNEKRSAVSKILGGSIDISVLNQCNHFTLGSTHFT
jgi:riboflavin kinase